VILATRPDLVDRSSLGPRDVDERIRQAQQVVRALRGALPVATRLVSSSGATGDPLGATAEAGSAILGRATSELRTVIESLLRLDLETFRRT
jgi:creatinine amidohydrolase/Fe(II)-dependent formamide hydrolase-like protein